ncbi:type II toxin-antitoxin system VapC family toxin [Barrientosiimonas endolithica]|uniref:type II toxin-antitoxin system VapC family toxin n=1 Tax=Barrientosiimonas endolithica TaxID=1535208 RepID=UPI0033059061
MPTDLAGRGSAGEFRAGVRRSGGHPCHGAATAADHPEEREIAWSRLTEIWPDVDVVEVDTQLLATAAELTSEFSLRGYDAVHCASAKLIDDPDLVVAAGDAQLLDAWSRLGLAVLDVNQG